MPGSLLYFEALLGFTYACNGHPAGWECFLDGAPGPGCSPQCLNVIDGALVGTRACMGKGFGNDNEDDPFWIKAARGEPRYWHKLARPSSNHPGVVIVGFGDGSVRPLSVSVDQFLYTIMMMPRSGEVKDLSRLL